MAADYVLPGSQSWTNFDVVGESYREKTIVSLLGGRPKKFESVDREFEAELVPEPDNPHGKTAISVRIEGKVVGYLDKDSSRRYWNPICRLVASGAHVRTAATVSGYTTEEWSSSKLRFQPSVRIFLPEPDKLLPLNAESLRGIAVLPWGRALQVTGEDNHFDHLFNYVPATGEGLVVLTMHEQIQRLKNGTEKRLIEVRLDGERVGQMTPTSSAHFLPTVAHAEDMGVSLGVWATIKGSGLAAELVTHGARASELSDAWLSDMPSLPRLVQDAPSYEVPDAYTEHSAGSRLARAAAAKIADANAGEAAQPAPTVEAPAAPAAEPPRQTPAVQAPAVAPQQGAPQRPRPDQPRRTSGTRAVLLVLTILLGVVGALLAILCITGFATGEPGIGTIFLILAAATLFGAFRLARMRAR